MDELRRPLLFASIVLILFVVLIELGSGLVTKPDRTPRAQLVAAAAESGVTVEDESDFDRAGDIEGEAPPGMGITDLALLDAVLLFTMLSMGVALVAPERLQGRIQGIATLVVSLLLLIGSIVLLVKAVLLTTTMASLFVAAPFGTLAYLAVWGSFPRGAAQATLALIVLLKLAFVICLALAHQRFLKMKSLMLLVGTSLLATLVVSFLHGIVPFVLVSITDGIAAIVVTVLALIWSIVLLIGSLPAIAKALWVKNA